MRDSDLITIDDFIGEQVEADNIAAVRGALPFFFYEDASNDRILNILNGHLDADNAEMDEFLGVVGVGRRVLYPVRLTAETDPNYQHYRNFICDCFTDGDLLPHGTSRSQLSDYETYSLGIIPVNKQPQRLFKFLRKTGLVRYELIEKWTTARSGRKPLYICISRNPVDYLMCSTNQSFTSCLDLSSPYSGAYYMGLLSMVLDPNRAIAFLTDGTLKDYELRDKTIKHYSVNQRSWVLRNSKDDLWFINDYPSRQVDFAVELNMKINTPEEWRNNRLRRAPYTYDGNFGASKYKFQLAEYKTGDLAMIYIDRFGVKETLCGGYEYTDGGDCGCRKEWSWERGFNAIESYGQFSGICVHCNNYPGVYAHDGEDRYCESCYNTLFYRCTYCFATHNRGDERTFCGSDYCSVCYGTLFSECEGCGELLRTESAIITLDKLLCDRCYRSNYRYCWDCGRVLRAGDLDDNVPDYEILCYNCNNTKGG